MKALGHFIKSYFLQFILSIAAIISGIEAHNLGETFNSANGTYEKEINGQSVDIGTSVAVSSGYSAGALAMGLICCTCIVMIVWIENNKSKLY